jgi:hypothetical protein
MLKIATLLALAALAACVTVNIYFPAAEVRQDAERVVKEAYGIQVTTPAPEGDAQQGTGAGSWLSPGVRQLLDILGPATASAQDYVNLNNAATRGLEAQVKDVTGSLAPYYASGNVGIDADGFATLRDNAGLDVKQVGQVNRLVAQDRAAKTALYKEKASAAGTPDKAAEVQRIYADLWKKYAASGTWVQNGSSWAKK